MTGEIILVDEHDREVGTEEKLAAHKQGLLHRAFSTFVFNKKGELLLQSRAEGKYHSAGLWSNTCCSHPRPGEELLDAATRRLKEEMRFSCKLTEQFSFIYRVKLGPDLYEHEFDHVLTGEYDGVPKPDANEVGAWKWADIKELMEDIRINPEKYTYWLRQCIDRVIEIRKQA